MSQRDVRLVGGLYRTGMVITAEGIMNFCTAYNRNTNDMVGLFVIEFPPAFQPQAVQHLLQPLEKRRAIISPHVLQVQSWGIDGNRAYIATNPPRGVTLRHMQDTEDIDFKRAIAIVKHITQGLQALHQHAIVGLDLRPQLLTVETVDIQDNVQIDDIGLRSLLHSFGYKNSHHIDDLSYLDPRYTPPEYIHNGSVGPWSDTYQVGLLLFELITGRPPFVGRNHAETGVMQSNSPVPQMKQFKHDTPTSLQDVVDRALAKKPEDRFASADALFTALEAVHIPSRPLSTQGVRPIHSNMGLTSEIPELDEDVSLYATVIKKPRGSEQLSATLPTEKGVYAYLFVEKEGKEIEHVAITSKSVVIGRVDPKRGVNPDIDLSILDPNMTISRQHARIRFEENLFYIEDLKSRNKTRLGELTLTPLQPELLRHGDIIRFGSVRMVFKVPGA